MIKNVIPPVYRVWPQALNIPAPAIALLHNNLNTTLNIQFSSRAAPPTVVLAAPRRETCPPLGVWPPRLSLRDDVGSVTLGADFVEAHAEATGYSAASHSTVSASATDRATASLLLMGEHAPRVPGITPQASAHVTEGTTERYTSQSVDEQRLLVIARGRRRQSGCGTGGTVRTIFLLLVPGDVVTQRRGKAGR